MKPSRLITLFFILAASFSGGPIWSQIAAGTAPAKPAGPDIVALDHYIALELEARRLVGLSAAVVIDGRIVLAKAYGKAVVDGPAVTVETPFAVGSITKQFTSACILKLAEAGKLSVEDRIANYYPDLPRAQDVTLLDLMNHVSGYRDFYPLDFVDREKTRPIEPDELIRRFAGAPLDFEPRSRWSYSNTGYVILGRVVEKVSGKALGQFLTDEIFVPLGLTHTYYEPDPETPGFARGHTTFALSPTEKATPEARGWHGGAGALYSTANDIAAWDLALVTGKVLNPASYALMTKLRELDDGRFSWYGCGLSLSWRNNRVVLTHGGAVAGFAALNTVIPSTRSAAVLLSNSDNRQVNAIFNKLVDAILPGLPWSIPAVSGPPAVETQKTLLAAYQVGKLDRTLLGEEFNYFLTEVKLRAASLALAPYGAPTKIDLESTSERGGMEVSIVNFTFPSGVLRGQMYRTPDGKVQQFFVSKT